MCMKKIIFTFTLFLSTINLMAQEHLSFKGIPIEGSITEFCKKLKNKGFTSIGHENNISIFSGDFTGRESTVAVYNVNASLSHQKISWRSYDKCFYLHQFRKDSDCQFSGKPIALVSTFG